MINDNGMRSSLRLATLARIIQDERVDERQVAQKKIGVTLARKSDAFARKPLQRSVLAHVDDRIGTPAALGLRSAEPAVKGDIVVCRRQIRCVINSVRIYAISTRRLQRYEGVAKIHRRE